MQELFYILRSYLFSVLPLAPFILGFIFSILNNFTGAKRIFTFLSVSIFTSLLYNALYFIFFNPYIFINLQYLLSSFSLYIQLLNSLVAVLGGIYFALLIKYVVKRQVKALIGNANLGVQPEIPKAPLGKGWKILIAIIIFAILAIGGYFGYMQIKNTGRQSKALDRYQKEAQAKAESNIKYFTQKIATVFAIGGNVIGNKKGVYSESSSVEYYSPKNDKWMPAPNLETPRAYASAVGTQDKLYVFGGSTLAGSETPLASVEEFDPNTNSWSYRKPMTEGRSMSSAVFLNSKIYVIGGQGNSYQKLNTVDIYDPAKDEWSSGPAMPGGIVNEAPLCGRIGIKIYCLGVAERGYTLVLDTQTNVWEKIGTENRSSTFVGIGAAVGGKIVSVVSRPPDQTYLNVYNPGTDSFAKNFTSVYIDKNNKPVVNFPNPIDGFSIISLGDYLLVVGGDTSSGPRPEVFVINTAYPQSWFPIAFLKTARKNAAIAQLPILYGNNQEVSGSIGGTVFTDSNKNLQLDSGERVVPNVKIILVTTRTYYTGTADKRKTSEDFGNDLAVTYTDSRGNYAFNNVSVGKYQVQVEDPKNVGSRSVIAQYLSGGKITQSFELKAGDKVENYNFGIL